MERQDRMQGKRNLGYDTGYLSLERYFSQQRRQALEIEKFITDEFARCSRTSRFPIQRRSRVRRETSPIEEKKLRTIVCSNALDMLIDCQPTIVGLITEIRSEYQKFISVLSQGQYQFSFLRDEITKSMTDPLSLMLLRKRKEQLKNRIAILIENNKSLQDQLVAITDNSSLDNITVKQNEHSKTNKDVDEYNGNKNVESALARANVSGHAVLKKMSISAATDLGKLIKYSAELQTEIQKLKSSLKSQYASKAWLQDLKDQLSKKEITQHHLQLYNARLKEHLENLRTATESLQCKSQKPSTMSGMVNKALENHRQSDQFAVKYLETLGIVEDDDPERSREADSLMEYVDTFNELIGSKQYEQAAKHAANSPKGILRSYDTIKTFKQIDESMDNGKSTALIFCEALMITAKGTDNLSAGLSCEVIRCALKNQRLDLVSHWLTKNCLTYSLPLANLLMDYCTCQAPCQCGSVDLAKDIFSYLNAHRQASLCLLSTGKIHQMIQYGEDHMFTADDYIYLCRRFPSTKLLSFLMSAHCGDKGPELISFPMVVNILLESNNSIVLTELLQEIYSNGLVSKDRTVRTLTDLLLAETVSDEMTRSKWDRVVELCSENSLNEIGIELLAILTVREAMDNAAYKYLMDYIS